MGSDNSSSQHRPPLWPGLLGVVLLAAGLLGTVVLVAAWKDVSVSSLTRDTATTAGLKYYAGFLYHIGILVWGATVASCLLGAAIWSRNSDAHALRAFLLASAALMLVFALDDVFQLRGELYPDHLGLSEIAVFAVYAMALCVFAIIFGSTMLRTEYIVLAAAAALFVVWLGLRQFGFERAFQDGVKLVGQLTLLLYFFRTSAYGIDSR